MQKQKSTQDTLQYMVHRIAQGLPVCLLLKKKYAGQIKVHGAQKSAQGLPFYLLCEEQVYERVPQYKRG